MYLTEQEAKAKWCPFSRATLLVKHISPSAGAQWQQTALAANRGTDNCQCLASGCMAWRWLTDQEITGWCGLAATPPNEQQSALDPVKPDPDFKEVEDEIRF